MTGATLGGPEPKEITRTDQIHEQITGLASRLLTVHERIASFLGRTLGEVPPSHTEGLDADTAPDILSRIIQQTTSIQATVEQLEACCNSLERIG